MPAIVTEHGSLLLFRIFGIRVYLHWTWFLVAAWFISERGGRYSSLAWTVVEYLALFGIVLLHEFGHSLACRQVGGRADKIVLWPLGGLAFVAPPQRPGAMLWSIAAGPLVNVALIPVLAVASLVLENAGAFAAVPDLGRLFWYLSWINAFLLIFNVLPVYPLDGGQILRSLLWFRLGRARSLFIATIVGFVGAAGLAALAVGTRNWWLGVLVLFVLSHCWDAFKHARALVAFARVPRNPALACPACGSHPPAGAIMLCERCKRPFDPFATRGDCPNCPTTYPVIRCVDCGAGHPIEAWTPGMGRRSQ